MSRKATSHSPAYTSYNQIKLIRGGQLYFNCLEELIDKAQKSIHLQVYIFDEDETGGIIKQKLMDAAQRGVAVYLLLDGYASNRISKQFIADIRSAGINFRWFEPILKGRYFYFGRRLHHKVFISDSTYALVGGINISNRYNDMPGQAAWLDWAVYAKGQISEEIYAVCVDMWKQARWNVKKEPLIHAPPAGPVVQSKCLVRVRRNDWVKRENQISSSYFEMLHWASSRIIIMSSYFLPGRKFKHKLAEASRRGVQVIVIVAGLSDVNVSKQAERYIYTWLLNNNIEIYEYTNNVLHGKVAVCDSQWATIGSYNINNISTYASIELNLDISDREFALSAEKNLLQIMADECRKLSITDYNTMYNPFERLFQYCCYEVIRLIFYVLTFYFKHLP